jgi:hypothetical protein
MIKLCEDVVAHLGVEAECTVAAADGVGFVAGELGVWMTVEEKGAAPPRFRAEVRLARQVPDDETISEFVDRLNHRGLLGCWVHDQPTGILALSAGIDLSTTVREDTVAIAAQVVSSMVASAEELAYKSAPQRDLGAAKALTLVGGVRRKGEHPLFRRHTGTVLEQGRTADTARVSLCLAQDVMLYLVPGWTFEHDTTATTCEDDQGFVLVVRVAQHPAFGYGLMIALGSQSRLTIPAADAHRRAFELNRSEARRPGLGAWAVSGPGLEYRTFLPNSLLELANRDLPELRLVSAVIRDTAARARPSLVPLRAVAEHPDRTLLKPDWAGDTEAEILARRDPINDGLHAPDSYVWLDRLGRAAATTESSFELWRSRLHPVDVDDPTVAGYSDWFQREAAHRHGKRRTS